MARAKKNISEVKDTNANIKVKNITINKIEDAVKNNYVDHSVSDLCGNEIIILRTLSFDNMVSFVDGVVSSCFDSKTGQYMAEVKEFVVKMNTINFYTNISLPDNIQRKYDIVYKLWDDVWKILSETINTEQYGDMVSSIDRKIEHILNTKASDIISRVNYISESSEKIVKMMSDLFDGISKEDISIILNAIAQNGGSIDEKKITEQILEHMENNNV